MAKYVPDVKTQRWVIISTGRTHRPSAAPEKKQTSFVCPFCVGNEKMTPPEVYRIGGGENDAPGWLVRVVPNKYPITDTHEVIIHSTDDSLPIEKLAPEQLIRVLTAYRDRYVAHESDGHVLIFCNQGFGAGASLKHPHTQLVVVPRQINLDSVHLEPIANVVFEEGSFVAYCPDFSQWPYEVWIAPKQRGTKFGTITDGNLVQLGGVLRKTLLAIDIAQKDPIQPLVKPDEPFVYNYYIYHGVNWFVRIIPRAISRAGFELGTGLNVNVVDPTVASERLRNIIEKGQF